MWKFVSWGVCALLLVAGCSIDNRDPKGEESAGGDVQPVHSPTPAPSETPAEPFPGAQERVMSVAAAGDRVLVLTQGRTLWTLVADGEWSARRNLPIDKRQEQVLAMSPNGVNGVIHPFLGVEVTPGPHAAQPFLVTTDGGRTWTRSTPPADCGCGATATDAGFFYLGSERVYRSADGVSNWQRSGRSQYLGALFARGGALVVHVHGGKFAVSSDEGRTWRALPDACRTAGAGYDPNHEYVFNIGLAAGEEIVVGCSGQGQHQVVRTAELAHWEQLGPTFTSAATCCYPIADDAAVGTNLLVTDGGVREIDLPLDQQGLDGVYAVRAGHATYLDYFSKLFASNDDGLTWTQLTR